MQNTVQQKTPETLNGVKESARRYVRMTSRISASRSKHLEEACKDCRGTGECRTWDYDNWVTHGCETCQGTGKVERFYKRGYVCDVRKIYYIGVVALKAQDHDYQELVGNNWYFHELQKKLSAKGYTKCSRRVFELLACRK